MLAAVQSRLVEGVRPDNPIVAMGAQDADFGLPSWIAGMDQEIVRQAAMVAYIDSYWLLGVLLAATAPLCFIMRRPGFARARGTRPA